MLRLADLVDQNISEFARLEALSMGKPVSSYMDQIGTATLRCKYPTAFRHGRSRRVAVVLGDSPLCNLRAVILNCPGSLPDRGISQHRNDLITNHGAIRNGGHTLKVLAGADTKPNSHGHIARQILDALDEGRELH